MFDFYAGNISRAPDWMVKYGLEWLFRLIKEPRRLWRRYWINNSKFIVYVTKEYFSKENLIKKLPHAVEEFNSSISIKSNTRISKSQLGMLEEWVEKSSKFEQYLKSIT